MLPFLPTLIPNLIQVAPFVIAFAILCAGSLRKHADVFYALWTLAVVAVTWFDPVISIMGESTPSFVVMYQAWVDAIPLMSPALDTVVTLLTSSYTGVCIYFIVMFIGAFEKTPLVKRLLSIRSELSVIGGIIIMGHVIRIIDFPFLFMNPMWASIWGDPAVHFMFIAAVIIGPLLTLVFLIPWITSFKVIRNRMSHSTWKKTQKLAYPFLALMVAQGFFLAVGHLMYGYPYDGSALVMSIMSNPDEWVATFAQQVGTAWLYVFLGTSYLILRLRKYQRDKKKLKKSSAAALQDRLISTAE